MVYFILTFGSPLLGVVICTVGGAWCYRFVKSDKINRVSAAIVYFVATLIPIGTALMCIGFGNYLADTHGNYVFFGEETFGLCIFMLYYIGFAILSNFILWLILARMKTKRSKI